MDRDNDDVLTFLTHLRDSMPQTRYFLRQWNALYAEFGCEICETARSRVAGGVASRSTARWSAGDRYTACVNLRRGDDGGGSDYDDDDVDDGDAVHVCNMLPVVIGSELDVAYRSATRVDGARLDGAPIGAVFAFNNYWVYESFLCTDSRLCHRYRAHSSSAEATTRLYVYDSRGKGHMLFTRANDSELWLRDSDRRETRLIDAAGNFAARDCEVLRDFVARALWRTYRVADAEAFCVDFFAYARVVSSAVDSSEGEEGNESRRDAFARVTRDIDDLENKRIASAPALYAALLRCMRRALDEAPDYRARAAIVAQYGAMSHRANLLRFISKKTHVRYDWNESMRRQLKSEMRGRAHSARKSGRDICSGGNGGSGSARATGRRDAFRVPDAARNSARVQQQFYCAKVHDDVEYDYELVKRMKVVNLNAMKCLQMPRRFERFFSFFNVGNIGNAGRVMTRVHSTRESFFPDVERAARRTVAWLRRQLIALRATERALGAVVVAVNEVPIVRCDLGEGDDERAFAWRLFLAMKARDPMLTFDATRLCDGRLFANVRARNGVPLRPVTLVPASRAADYARARDRSLRARACDECGDGEPRASYYGTHFVTEDRWLRDDVRGGGARALLPACRRHTWCSRSELALYERALGPRALAAPLLHEVACHGLLSVAAYPFVTDISKTIVSINAHRRAVRLVERAVDGSDAATPLLDHRAGKTSFLRVDREPRGTEGNDGGDGGGYAPRHSARLFFAFGDFGMLNCEDGYVLNESAPLRVDTVLVKRVAIAAKGDLCFRADATTEYTWHRGVSVRVGAFHCDGPATFSSGGGVVVTTRRCDVSSARRRLRGRSSVAHVYDVRVEWNASYLQVPERARGTHRPVRREFGPDDDDDNDANDGDDDNDGESWSARFVYADGLPVRAVEMEIGRDRALRVRVYVVGARQTLKLQNSFGQKGIAHYADLSDLVAETGESVDVVSSMFSFVGRAAIGQALEQRATLARIVSRRSGRCVGVGGYGDFFVSCDSPHNNFIYSVTRGGENPMRMCRLTYESLLENDVSSAAFVKTNEFETGITNPYAGIPRNVDNALECYAVYHRRVFLESRRLYVARRRKFDEALLAVVAARAAKRQRSRSRPSDDVAPTRRNLDGS